MKQPFFYITIILVLISCSSNTDKQEQKSIVNHQKSIVGAKDTIPELALWANDYITKYLDGNKDRLRKVDDYPIAYIKDTTTREDVKYVMVKIGHSFEHRYVTKQWIYIDSLSKVIYEYDLVNDSLIVWE